MSLTIIGGQSGRMAPAAHAPVHKSGGADPIKLDELAAPTDVTTLNVSVTAHGLAPKLPNDATKFLDGTGNFTKPADVAATWGSIGGTLSAQTDLVSALSGKVSPGLVTASGLTMNTGKILGRVTASAGAVEELSTIPAANMPAHTGDVTSTAGAVGLTIAAAAVTLAKQANLAATSVIGNASTSAATPAAISFTELGRYLHLYVQNWTSNLSLDSNPSNGRIFENTGASALSTLTLPSAPDVGYTVSACIQNINGIKFSAQGSHTVTVGTTTSSAGGYTTSTAIGSVVTLAYIATNKWVALSSTGTWTTA